MLLLLFLTLLLGFWGTCSDGDDTSVDNDCNYFSHVYYRDLNRADVFPLIQKGNERNATYRKIAVVTLPNDGVNFTANVSFFEDRTIKRSRLTNSLSGNDLPIGGRLTDSVLKGYIQQNSVDNGKDVGEVSSYDVAADNSFFFFLFFDTV